jgi:hypothetical protein
VEIFVLFSFGLLAKINLQILQSSFEDISWRKQHGEDLYAIFSLCEAKF